MPSDPSSRHWWPRPTFNSIASAIGLKSRKKCPSLAIQSPPPALLAQTTSPTPVFTNRPSIATSRVDSSGPLTPVDYECQSLLTLSDTDPFAGRPPPVPQIPSKKTPLSLDTSVPHRISSASSSSLSTNHPSVLSPTVGFTESWKLSKKPSITNIPYSRSISKRPGSCSTVVGDETHFTLPRPKLRARGMTDGGSTQKSGFFSDERPTSQKASTSTLSPPISSTEHNSPRVVIQQASLSRITGPPCAPPAHSLPAAPHSPPRLSSPMQTSKPLATNPISTSSISFVSSSSHEVLPTLSHPLREKRYSERSVFSQDHDPGISSTPTKRESKTAPSSPRRLKKPLSHQSLTSKSNIQPSTPPKLPPENIVDKVFRKQRALPHTHSPIPPIPNPVGQPSSTNHTTPPLTDSVKAATERRTSGNSSLGRKRLFSHSGAARPSISHPLSATTQDDSLSVFSLRSDRSSNLVPLKPWASPKVTPQSSFWDEVGSPAPSSPARSTSEYMLQPILSAAEVAKLEASIENLPGQSTRGRTLSASTTVSEDLDFTPAGLSPRPTTRPRSKGSMTGKSPAVKNPALYSPVSSRAQSPSPPSPNNENHENDPRNTRMYHSFSSELAASLPLPPRLRQRPQLVFRPERSNTAPLNLSPVAKPSRSKSAVEKSTHRRSIMRKPSFLEIDDDTDQDIDLFSGEATTHSFLDLARESFEMNHRDDP